MTPKGKLSSRQFGSLAQLLIKSTLARRVGAPLASSIIFCVTPFAIKTGDLAVTLSGPPIHGVIKVAAADSEEKVRRERREAGDCPAENSRETGDRLKADQIAANQEAETEAAL